MREQFITWKTYNELHSLSNEELYEVWYMLNTWKWSELLKEKPKNFDNLPEYKRTIWDFLLNRKTKHMYIKPIHAEIQRIIVWREVRKRKHLYLEKLKKELIPTKEVNQESGK